MCATGASAGMLARALDPGLAQVAETEEDVEVDVWALDVPPPAEPDPAVVEAEVDVDVCTEDPPEFDRPELAVVDEDVDVCAMDPPEPDGAGFAGGVAGWAEPADDDGDVAVAVVLVCAVVPADAASPELVDVAGGVAVA